MKPWEKVQRDYFLEIKGSRTKFRTKSTAIRLGKVMLKESPEVKLIEVERLWLGPTKSKLELQPVQEYDRTNLLKL